MHAFIKCMIEQGTFKAFKKEMKHSDGVGDNWFWSIEGNYAIHEILT